MNLEMKSIPLTIVDAFTIDNNTPFTGNPAAVCLLEYDDDVSDEKKQKIATEMNLSETAFVAYGWSRSAPKLISDDGILRRTLRWFTPTTEVPLCGHATVASAKTIFSSMRPSGSSEQHTVEFQSKFRGTLGATITWKTGLITLNFPANPTKPLNILNTAWGADFILTALGPDVPSDAVSDIHYSTDTKILVLRLKDELTEKGLKMVQPNFDLLGSMNTDGTVRDLIVTVKGSAGKDQGPHFYSRFFAPWDGIKEDPVTGLAHTVLTPYWTNKLQENGPLKARQHSARGGDLLCLLQGDRVRISGQAFVTLRGEFLAVKSPYSN